MVVGLAFVSILGKLQIWQKPILRVLLEYLKWEGDIAIHYAQLKHPILNF